MKMVETSANSFLRFSRERWRVRASNFAYKLVVFLIKSAREELYG